MELNTYVLEIIVRDRIAEMRAHVARQHLLEAVRGARRPRRTAMGDVLRRLVAPVLGVWRDSLAEIRRRDRLAERRGGVR